MAKRNNDNVDNLKVGGTLNKEVSLIITFLMIFCVFITLLMPVRVAATDLVVSSTYTVSGTETWDNITVTGTGKLVVPSGATLQAINITMESGSIFESTGGNVSLTNPNPGGDVGFNGNCRFFNVTSTSNIDLVGTNGFADTSNPGPYESYIPTSKGGDATLDIIASEMIVIANSTIDIVGGDGFDLPPSTSANSNAWTNSIGLSGYVAAGGNTTIYLNSTSTVVPLIIDNSTLTSTAGDGGDAADGAMKYGGGYSNGLAVSGYVGAGGKSTIHFWSGAEIIITNLTTISKGGKGGHAGNGGGNSSFFNQPGGGGGGYSGGNGGDYQSSGQDGGPVSGHVGSGGDSKTEIHTVRILIELSNITAIAGDGGDAGNGGGNGNSGTGGGGYGGGGGSGRAGSVVALTSGKGTVTDFVGVGGNSTVIITATETIEIIETNISAYGGHGGNAGNGGGGASTFRSGGGGGGGYAGGGGAGEGFTLVKPLNTTVNGWIGSGGNAVVNLTCNSIFLLNSTIYVKGGPGGQAGYGASLSAHNGGGGGGGYGGGGGGCYPYGGAGASTNVSGNIGIGGLATYSILASSIEVRLSNVTVLGGDGGAAGNGGKSDLGGGGGGGYGGGGGGGRWDDGNIVNDHGGHGGNTSLYGRIGTGNDANITLITQYLEIRNSSLRAKGGTGGDNGTGNPISVSGGSGGGGYGGAGGGGTTDIGSSILGLGGISKVNDRIGDGGNASVYINSESSMTHIDNFTNINATGGMRGDPFTSPGANGTRAYGGDGLGLDNSNGTTEPSIPMSIPILLSPQNNSNVLNSTPTFEWLSVHDSTTNGSLSNYTIEIDDNNDFSSPVDSNTTTSTSYVPMSPMLNGKYYWRVKAFYSTPPGSSAGWSEVWVLTIGSDISPPVIYVKDPGESPGQSYSVGDIITITWTAEDDGQWPNSGNVVNISYGVTQLGGTTIAIQTVNDGSHDWNTATASPGTYYVNITVYDLGGYEVGDSSNYTFDLLMDTTKPSSKVDDLPTFTTTSTLTITATATDAGSGVQKVELWHKKNSGSWITYGEDSASPWSWNFDTTTTGGDGLYQFYSRAWDIENNYEDAPSVNDTWTIVDTMPPIADAGPDKHLDIGDTVEFDGSGTEDNLDSLSELNFTWVVSKDGVLIDSLYGVAPSYLFDVEGQYEVELTVRDKAGNEGFDTVVVSILTPPDDSPNYWLILLIIAIVIVLILILYIIMRKKKKGDEESQPQQSVLPPPPPPTGSS